MYNQFPFHSLIVKLADPEAITFPLYAIVVTKLSWALFIVLTFLPVFKSQIFTVLSSLAEKRYFPFAWNCKSFIQLSCPVNVPMFNPVFMSQTLIVLSRDPDIKNSRTFSSFFSSSSFPYFFSISAFFFYFNSSSRSFAVLGLPSSGAGSWGSDYYSLLAPALVSSPSGSSIKWSISVLK
jgi:hypothetical protein